MRGVAIGFTRLHFRRADRLALQRLGAAMLRRQGQDVVEAARKYLTTQAWFGCKWRIMDGDPSPRLR
jgi:hypothetical protein